MSEGNAAASRTAWRDGFVQAMALVVIAFGMQAARAWLLPICFALLFAVLAAVPMRLLLVLNVPRMLAAGASAAALVIALFLVLRGLSVSLAEFGAQLPRYEPRMQQLLGDAVAFLDSLGIHVAAGDLIDSIEPRTWFGFVQQSVGGALSLLSGALLATFALVFLLWEGDRLLLRLRRAYGERWREGRSRAMVADLQRYVGVKTGTSILTGLGVYLLNRLLDVPFAALWGLCAFVLNFIPIVGSILAAIPALFLSLVLPELGAQVTFVLAIGYLAINNGISNLLEPMLMGRELGLPAFVVLLSLAFWGWLWGAGGMFLAVPLTIVVGTVVADRDDLPLLRALVGREPR